MTFILRRNWYEEYGRIQRNDVEERKNEEENWTGGEDEDGFWLREEF
jgi:hypothetical protein